ncbi:MAG: DEAD/DEAH box helicase [Planctomycetaceae bacterium]|nr:DEAD/DEAH box helicase [Planctomycetaceae bacterium]
MTPFEQLHPAVQHHVVNSLGWRELRPFQERAIEPILAGDHALILAPTAGGKTESAILPVLSRMLSENWTGLSVLYICPIKALLNNLDVRLQRYATLLGRRAGLWHGDIKTGQRRRILADPPDCLLTTPESLEVMLVSRQVERKSFFSNLRVVIIDEIHAFAGDDRGWHLLAVLERISRITGRELQRLGLSATVGNPEALCEWLACSCQGPRRVMLPPEAASSQAEVTLDFVGSLENAAMVISRLHRGEKRLVFLDSRSRAEELAVQLRGLEVTTFVTHSSLSPEQRHEAEKAFATRDDCVIVATSVLELGIDVGNLDRVIQIDAPPTVSNFLQRMGRTGRRHGTARNCLFLATSEDALLQSAAIIRLWEEGFVEPIEPPKLPLHVFAQQLMGLARQESGIGRQTWPDWIRGFVKFAGIEGDTADQIINHMVTTGIFWEDAGILWFGRRGEEEFGRRNFMDILSMITSEPLFAVKHGRSDLGFVHQLSFATGQGGQTSLLLSGRSWRVTHLDWPRKVAYVEPSKDHGKSRWLGGGHSIAYEVSQAIRKTLTDEVAAPCWSRRAATSINDLRSQFDWLREGTTVVKSNGDEASWWTFAGSKANAAIAAALRDAGLPVLDHDNLSVAFEVTGRLDDLDSRIQAIRHHEPEGFTLPISPEMVQELKFSSCLPEELAVGMLEARLVDKRALGSCLQEPVRHVG